MIQIYTDGSCRNNGKENNIGAYGFIVVDENNSIIERFVQREINTTNQRCELLGLIAAYEYCSMNGITCANIYTDSAYCCNACNNKWYDKWKKNNFKTSKNTDVINQDLWHILIPYFKNPNFNIIKVEGHASNYFNNFIDSLVTTASDTRTDYIKDCIFGDLTAVQIWSNCKIEGNGKYVIWKTICKCGQVEYKTSHSLKNGKNNCTHYSGTHAKDLTQQTFGFLKPITIAGKTKDNYALWECLCTNCNTKTLVSSRCLKKQLSCGCIKSKGEALLSQIFNENKINFIREYSFVDLQDKGCLRFDFAIILDNKPVALIEYQGKQHYQYENNGWNNKEHLHNTQMHDNMKRDYCEKNNIPLILIPYTDYNIINYDYIIKKLASAGVKF